MSERSQNKREAQKFRATINQLGYENIGDFVELVGGIVSMLIKEDSHEKDAFKVMGEQLIMHTGIIIEQIGHLDKVIEKNEDLKKAAEKAENDRDKKDRAMLAASESKIVTPPRNANGPMLFGADGNPL